MPVAPKSVRIQSSCQYLFTLLGSTGAKAAHRTLMILTPRRRKSISKIQNTVIVLNGINFVFLVKQMKFAKKLIKYFLLQQSLRPMS